MTTPPRQVSPTPMPIFVDNEMPSRGFLGQLSLVLFQPKQFFRSLNTNGTKHWLWASILILSLIAYSAVQQATPASSGAEVVAPPMDMGAGIPPMDGMPIDGGITSPTTSDPTEAWMTALTAAGAQVIYWAVLTLVLSEVSLFKGQAPQLGRNLQIAIWASLPLALMAALQILFILGGGKVGQTGFAGFLSAWEGYAGLNIYLQSALHALASQFTLFWLWSLALVYIGARETLKGKHIVVASVLFMWITMLIFAYGFQSYQELSANLPTDTGFESEFPIEGEMPSFEMPQDMGQSPEGEISPESEMTLEPEAVQTGRKG